MPYVTKAQLIAEVPPQHLADALDDDAEGGEDSNTGDTVMAQASAAVDGFLASLYPVPFADPAPAAATAAAFAFAGEMIYARRGVTAETNPFTKRAEFWRERLQKIGSGELPLDATIPRQFAPGAAITEPVDVDASTR